MKTTKSWPASSEVISGRICTLVIMLILSFPSTVLSAPAYIPNPPEVTLPPATLGQPYSTQLTANWGLAPYKFSDNARSGAPSALANIGLTLSQGGLLSGTPTKRCDPCFLSILVEDANGTLTTQSYRLAIGPNITLSPTTNLPRYQVGSHYSTQITASGGTAPYVFTLVNGTLPEGIVLNSDGSLSGTPTNSPLGGYITILVRDANGIDKKAGYFLSKTPNAELIPYPPLKARIGVPYTGVARIDSPLPQAVDVQGLPPGLNWARISSWGGFGIHVFGTPESGPNAAGTFTFDVNLINLDGWPQTVHVPITIEPQSKITVSPPPNGKQNLPYEGALNAKGAFPPFVYALVQSSLPPGLTLESSGRISGVPELAGTYTYTVAVSDSRNVQFEPTSVSMTISPDPGLSFVSEVPPSGKVGKPYSWKFTAANGTAPWTFALASGELPAGLILATDGTLSGSPTEEDLYSFTVRLTDADGYTATRDVEVYIGAAPTIVFTSSQLPNGQINSAYSSTLKVKGGTAPYSYEIIEGALPAGIALSGDTLAGTPEIAGTSRFSVRVTDSEGFTAMHAYTLTIELPLSVSAATDFPPIVVEGGDVKFIPVIVQGGTAPYAYTLSPDLPEGLVLNRSTGEITGRGLLEMDPTSFTMTVTDAAGTTVAASFELVIEAAPLEAGPGEFNLGQIGTEIDVQLTARGGTIPYVFSIEESASQAPDRKGAQHSGAVKDPSTIDSFPQGLELSSSGRLTGKVRYAGTYRFTVLIVDAKLREVRLPVTLVATARPDPTLDPTVVASLMAQTSTVREMAFAQTDNINRHLEAVRGCHASSNELTLQVEGQGSVPLGQLTEDKNQACDRSRVFWAGGVFNYREHEEGPGFSTPGLTLGADFWLNPSTMIGAAFGVGYSSTNFEKGVSNTAVGFSLTGYGLWSLTETLHLDALLGYGSVNLDLERQLADGNEIAEGSRNADQIFGALTASGSYNVQQLNLQPYLRAEFASSSLGGYREVAASSTALQYSTLEADAFRYTVGLRASRGYETKFGSLQPSLRFEYRNDVEDRARQDLRYADDPWNTYELWLPRRSDESGIVGAGLSLQFTNGLSASFEYSKQFGSSIDGDSVNGNLSWGFK